MNHAAVRDARTPRLSDWLWVAAAILVGGLLRGYRFWQIGLSHFDEGIYAFAGTVPPWTFTAVEQHGYYSPPLFPALVHAVYCVMGTAVDWGPAAVSLLSSLATIPLGYVIGRRVAGFHAGVLAAWLLAVDGMQIAFARTGLTDALFTFLLLLSVRQTERALVAPTGRAALWRTVVAGVCIGLAWNTKYHGFLPLVLAVGFVGGACWRRRIARLLLIAVIAAACYLPWAALFHVKHGYDSLVAHQRGYYQGPSALLDNWRRGWEAAAVLWTVAVPAAVAFWWVARAAAHRSLFVLAALGFVAGLSLVPEFFGPLLVIAGLWLPNVIRSAATGEESADTSSTPEPGHVRPGGLAFAWVLGWLVVLPALYTPYLRLWLPTATFGLIFIAAGAAAIVERLLAIQGRSHRALRLLGTAASAAALIGAWRAEPESLLPETATGYRTAAVQLAAWTRAQHAGLVTLARPPLLFYLAHEGVSFRRLAGDGLNPELLAPDEVLVVDHAAADSPAFAEALARLDGTALRLVHQIPVLPSQITRLDDYPAADLPTTTEPYQLRIYRQMQ